MARTDLTQAGEEHLAVWSREDVVLELVGSVAMAVQRGGAMAYLYGFDCCLHAVSAACKVAPDAADVTISGGGESGVRSREKRAAATACSA